MNIISERVTVPGRASRSLTRKQRSSMNQPMAGVQSRNWLLMTVIRTRLNAPYWLAAAGDDPIFGIYKKWFIGSAGRAGAGIYHRGAQKRRGGGRDFRLSHATCAARVWRQNLVGDVDKQYYVKYITFYSHINIYIFHLIGSYFIAKINCFLFVDKIFSNFNIFYFLRYILNN